MGSKVSKTTLGKYIQENSTVSRILINVIVPIFWALIPTHMEAHFPIIAGDKHHNQTKALPIENIHISKVMYQTLSKSKPENPKSNEPSPNLSIISLACRYVIFIFL